MRELPWDTRAVLSFCHPHGDGGRGDGDGPGQHQDVNRGWTIPGTLHWTSPEGGSHLQATWPQESRGPIRPPGAEGTGADASPREAPLRTRSDSPAAAAAAWAEARPAPEHQQASPQVFIIWPGKVIWDCWRVCAKVPVI